MLYESIVLGFCYFSSRDTNIFGKGQWTWLVTGNEKFLGFRICDMKEE